jgi:hypothetical protein
MISPAVAVLVVEYSRLEGSSLASIRVRRRFVSRVGSFSWETYDAESSPNAESVSSESCKFVLADATIVLQQGG